MPDALKQAYSGALNLEQLRGLRRGLLKVVAVFLKATADQQKAVSIDDVQVQSACCVCVSEHLCCVLQASVSFMGGCANTELLQDVLQLIYELLHPSDPSHHLLLACLAQPRVVPVAVQDIAARMVD